MTSQNRLTLCVLLGLVAVLHTASILTSFVDMWSYQLRELRINYEGGFVRRGLLGEIAFLINSQLGVASQNFYGFLFIVLVALQAGLFAALIWPLAPITPLFVATMLAPALIVFTAYDFGAYFRKDIFITIGLLGHALLARAAIRGTIESASYRSRALLALAPYLAIVTLIHENQMFLLPTHALLGYLACQRPPLDRRLAKFLAATLLPAVGVAVLATVFHGNQAVADAICASWGGPKVMSCEAIGQLSWSIGRSADSVLVLLRSSRALMLYGVFFAMAAALPLFISGVLAEAGDRPPPAIPFALAVLSPAVLFAVGWDWGRWIHLITMSMICLVMAGSTKKIAMPHRGSLFRVTAMCAALLYVVLWRVKHCCVPVTVDSGFFSFLSVYARLVF